MTNDHQPTVAAPPTICECEHVDHFEDANRAHPYQAIEAGSVSILPTDYGSFAVCDDCMQATHMNLP